MYVIPSLCRLIKVCFSHFFPHTAQLEFVCYRSELSASHPSFDDVRHIIWICVIKWRWGGGVAGGWRWQQQTFDASWRGELSIVRRRKMLDLISSVTQAAQRRAKLFCHRIVMFGGEILIAKFLSLSQRWRRNINNKFGAWLLRVIWITNNMMMTNAIFKFFLHQKSEDWKIFQY